MMPNKLMQIFATALLMQCIALHAKAQNIDEQLESIFSPLNKSRITTGMLVERGLFPHSPMPFNGTLTDSSYNTPLLQRSLYAGLHSSVISGAVSLASPELFYGNLNTANTGGVVLSMLHYNMTRIKDNAISLGLLSYRNGKLYDVTGSATPYQPFTFFAVAPVNAEAWGTTITFTLSSHLRMTNSTSNISQQQIDPGDGGGYRTFAFNTPLTVTYPTAGQKVVRMALTPSGGQTLRSHFRLTVHPTAQPPQPSPYDYSDDAILFEPVQGVHSGGVAFVKYSTSNPAQSLRKPLIVAEGIDPSSVLSFIPNNSINNFYGTTYNVILNGGERFWNALISEYDIVFLDYTNGVDDIFRNARLLVQLIEWVNQQKTNVPNAQPNVVMGMSMGGLVSKVALRRMEVESKNHDTRLYISLDSPHKGANVPPAYQALAWHVNGYLSFIDPSLSRLLYSPAMKQMLKYYPDVTNSTFSSSHHNTFMAQYESFIFPTFTRNVAVVNGSNAGTSLFPPYSSLIDVVHNAGKYKFTIKGYALPDKLNRIVYEANVEWRTNGWFWQWLGINEFKAVLRRYNSSTSHLPFDGAPGGSYPLSMFGGLPAGIDQVLNYNNFTFIPIASALAVNSINPSEAIGNQNLVGTGKTPFASYYSQSVNQSHIQFTPQNARFILNELSSSNLCTPISGASLSGPKIVCTSGATFTINNLPTAYNVLWSCSSNMVYGSGQGTVTYTVSAADPSTSNEGWVRAILTGPCGEVQLTWNVWVGVPSIPYDISGFPYDGIQFPSNSNLNFIVWLQPTEQGVNAYEWVVGGGTILNGQGTQQVDVLTDNVINGNLGFSVVVRVGSACGWSSGLSRMGLIVDSGGGGGSTFSIFPNPTSASSISISVSESKNTNNDMYGIEQIITSVRIFDKMGQLVIAKNYSGIVRTVNLNISSLQKGIYLLKINEVENHTFIKN